MRKLFLFVVLANLAFYAWYHHLRPAPLKGSDPTSQQIAPERVKIVAPAELPALVASRRAITCVELGPLSPADAGRAEEQVAALAPGLKVGSRKVEEPTRWWVYLPPLATRAAAVQRVAELKKQGIEDSSLISDDSQWRNGISLGVFRTEEAAVKRVEELRKRGVRGIETAPREAGTARVYVQLRDAPEPIRARLSEVRTGFPGAEVRECAAP